MRIGLNEITKLYYDTNEVGLLASSGVTVVMLTDGGSEPPAPSQYVIEGLYVNEGDPFTATINGQQVQAETWHDPSDREDFNRFRFDWEAMGYTGNDAITGTTNFSGTTMLRITRWTIPMNVSIQYDYSTYPVIWSTDPLEGVFNSRYINEPFFIPGIDYMPRNAYGGALLAFTGGTLNIPEGIRIIAPDALGGMNWYDEIIFPSTLEIIGEGAMKYCSGNLDSMNIPDSVELICDGAFSGFPASTVVHIGSGCDLIGDNAFADTASSIMYLQIHRTDGIVYLGQTIFGPTPREGTKILVPSTYLGSYQRLVPEYSNYYEPYEP